MTHTCHARDCEAAVPPRLFMCRRHWRALPKAMRAAIWATYRPGQEGDKRPSQAYLENAKAAIGFIASIEGMKKTCPRCGAAKLLIDFYAANRGDGRRSECKECFKAKVRAKSGRAA